MKNSYQFTNEQIEDLRLACETDYKRPVSRIEVLSIACTLYDLYQWSVDLLEGQPELRKLMPEESQEETKERMNNYFQAIEDIKHRDRIQAARDNSQASNSEISAG